MHNFLTILKKELKRIFTDYRMLLALFLPGILIFILYSIMGEVSSSFGLETYVNTTYRVAYTNNYASNSVLDKPILTFTIDEVLKQSDYEINTKAEYYPIYSSKIDEYKEKLLNDELDLLIVYSDNFENLILDDLTKEARISLFYNGASEISSHIYTLVNPLVATTYNNYLTNIDENNNYLTPNLANEDFLAKQILSFIFPMITVSILFSTIISIVPESIAGEKQRGTLTSILITPTKRSHIVFGKIISLSLVSFLSGLVSSLGIIGSIPKLMGGLTINFSAIMIAGLFIVIISMLLLFVALGSLASTIAKTIKEASSYLGPFMGIFMVLAILPAMVDTSSIIFSFIPFLNLLSAMNQLILTQTIEPLFLGLSLLFNTIYIAILVFVTTKLFNNENVIYNH